MSQRIGIGAVFDEEDFRQYNTIFQEGLANSKLPMQNKVYVNAVSTFLDSSTSIYTSFLALCQTVDNLDIRAFLVVGRQETIQRTSLVARHLGIPVLAYTTESLVERHVQVCLHTF
ncbi:hypothetical protein DPMN_083369 [Dreissena polymorpha]|uniref:Uncharacterized protein n=1 Tax=Dreissena polymorpha TaxID=45954 RepID=A0A9D3YB29_DREPO|nr:hypothetical protein DPMN_083369 [Dreissena polymorpha]